MDNEFSLLKLENQLCFPLYAASREMTKLYRPYLDELNLTYTQYISMMVLWDKKRCSVKELGETLYLDSGTLTPVLKSMEKKGYVRRFRSAEDERVLLVEITDEGQALREQALSVPKNVGACVGLNEKDAVALYHILYKLLDGMKEK